MPTGNLITQGLTPGVYEMELSPEEKKLLEGVKFTGSSSLTGGGLTQYFEYGGKQYSVNVGQFSGSGETNQSIINRKTLEIVQNPANYQQQAPVIAPRIPIYTSPGVATTPAAEVKNPAAVQSSVLPTAPPSPSTTPTGGPVVLPGSQGQTTNAPGGVVPQSYKIVYGDTLGGIASRNNLTLKQLLELNPQFRTNPDRIFPGQVVNLPPKITPPNVNPQEQQTIANYLASAKDMGPSVETRSSSNLIESLKKILEPSTQPPPAPSSESTYTRLRQEQGIGGLEDELNKVNQDITSLQNEIVSRKNQAKGQQVSTVFIDRQLYNIDATTRDAFNDLIAKKQELSDRIQTKTSVVNTLMQLNREDYQSALTRYTNDYNKNIQLYNILQTAQTQQLAEQNRVRDDARATLQLMLNNLKDKNLSFSSLPQDQQQLLNNLAVKGDLPTGVLSTLLTASKQLGDIKHTDSYTGADGYRYTQILIQKPDGTLSTQVIKGEKVNTQEGDDKSIQTFIDLGGKLADRVKNRTLTYQAAYSLLKASYPQASDQAIQSILSGVKTNPTQ